MSFFVYITIGPALILLSVIVRRLVIVPFVKRYGSTEHIDPDDCFPISIRVVFHQQVMAIRAYEEIREYKRLCVAQNKTLLWWRLQLILQFAFYAWLVSLFYFAGAAVVA